MAPPYEVSPYQLGLKLWALLDDVTQLLGRTSSGRRFPPVTSYPAGGFETPSDAGYEWIRQEIAELRRRVEALECWLETPGVPEADPAKGAALPGRCTGENRATATGREGHAAESLPSGLPQGSGHTGSKAGSRQAEPAPSAEEKGEAGDPGGAGAPSMGSVPDAGEAPVRLPREVTRQKALSAARRLRRLGEPVTLASVARSAGLKYSQVVYAFGRREGLLAELRED